MSDSDEELTPRERKQVIRLFQGLYVLSLILNVAVFVAIAYAGFERWNGLVIIPIGAASMFASRVAKKYTRNLLNAAMTELGQSSEQIEALPRGRPRTTRVQLLVPVATLVMLVVSALWFAIGLGIRWAVGD